MKKKDFVALAKRLLPHLTGFTVKGPLLFIPPVKHTLRGIYFEGSSFDARSFYVWMFFMPLCVPTHYVSFHLGRRVRGIGGGDRWNADTPNLLAELGTALQHEALPFLGGIESLHDVAKAATALQTSRDPYVQEAIAYALARAGDVEQAARALDQLVGLFDEKVPWQCEMAGRARALKSQMVSNPADVQRQLEAWEAENIHKLGLEAFR
jgi:hypothetical protein